jgi:Tetrapyrrole (Corrin/Porphyrin) Methylases
MTMPDRTSAPIGRLFGVGLGPGDPELITRKAARLIREADVVAFHSGTHGRSIARSIAAELLTSGIIEESLVYPVTTGETPHVNGYRGAIEDFYDHPPSGWPDSCRRNGRLSCCAKGIHCSHGGSIGLRFPPPRTVTIMAARRSVSQPVRPYGRSLGTVDAAEGWR